MSSSIVFELVSVPPIEKSSNTTLTPSPVWIASREVDHRQRGMIVLHEWFGVSESFKRQAFSWFGNQFLLALLVNEWTLRDDVYRGELASTVEEASHLMEKLDFTQALRDIRATIKYLKEQEKCAKIAIVGFGLGGCLALAAAIHFGKEFNVAVIFYGIPDSRFASPTKCGCPIQLHFGSDDSIEGFSDAKTQLELEKRLHTGSIDHEFYRYHSCGHAFTEPSHTDEVEVLAAALAKNRTLEFLEDRLLSPGEERRI